MREKRVSPQERHKVEGNTEFLSAVGGHNGAVLSEFLPQNMTEICQA